MPEKMVETDVLVIGGGLAGSMAAIKASEYDVDVTLVDKAGFGRSGCAATGIDHFRILFPEDVYKTQVPESLRKVIENCLEYTLEAIVKQEAKNADGMIDIESYRTWLTETYDRMKDLERLGIDFKYKGKYRLVPYRAGCSINYGQRDQQQLLAREVHRRGVKVFNRTMITGLLTHGNSFAGAMGFNVRSEDFVVFKAKSGVLATGSATNLFPNPTGLWSNNVYPPSLTGDGLVAALNAGAELVNMEFARGVRDVNIGFKNFPNGAFAFSFGPYAKIVDAKGQEFRFHVPGDSAKLLRSLEEGNRPIYLDLSELSEEELEASYWALENEGRCQVLLVHMQQEGVDLRKKEDKIEFGPPGSGWLSSRGSGVMVDKESKTALKGLFAAGDTVGPVWFCGPQAVVTGYRAGDGAARHSQKAEAPAIDEAAVEAEKQRIFAPLKREEGVAWQEAQKALTNIMEYYVNVDTRSEAMLNQGLAALKDLKDKGVSRLVAGNPHELMRVLGVMNLTELAEVIIRAALERKESRRTHHRIDYPHKDDKNWLKFVVVKKVEGETKITLWPTSEPISYRWSP